jgi:hypothetical protein
MALRADDFVVAAKNQFLKGVIAFLASELIQRHNLSPAVHVYCVRVAALRSEDSASRLTGTARHVRFRL